MLRSRVLMMVQILLVAFVGLGILPSRALSQQVPFTKASNLFEEYFNGLAAAPSAQDSGSEAAYSKLTESIGAMAPDEIAKGIPIIDRHLDDTADPKDRLAKPKIAGLLMFISWRPDGAELLASQMDRLADMLNDPSHSLSGIAALTLQHIGYKRPDEVRPILETALRAPEVNNATGVGPGISGILLQISPPSEVANDIVQYMRRPDLTDSQMISTIMGINISPAIPDAVAAELVRSLDRPNERIKTRALIGITGSSPSARNAARDRIQKMANDSGETPHVRRIAEEALKGQITENPELGK